MVNQKKIINKNVLVLTKINTVSSDAWQKSFALHKYRSYLPETKMRHSGILYKICDLSSIQMSFVRNIAPPYHDKKIEHLCDEILRSCVSTLIYSKGCQPNNVLSCKTSITHSCHEMLSTRAARLVKTPTLFLLEQSFWTLYWCCFSHYFFSVSLVICSLSPSDQCI